MTRTLLVALLALAACGDDDEGAPRIDMLAPAEAAAGGAIEVLGVRFCGPDAADVKSDGTCATPPNGFVTFGVAEGIMRAQVKSWKGTEIQVTVPALDPGVTRVIVTVNGLASNQRDFTVAAP